MQSLTSFADFSVIAILAKKRFLGQMKLFLIFRDIAFYIGQISVHFLCLRLDGSGKI